jgi:protein gp37
MSDKSKIEWTDATWNPVTGCTKLSAGCKFCYAERGFCRPYPGRDFTDVRMHEDRLTQPLHWKRPRKIFVNSIGDLFHEAVTREFLRDVFSFMEMCPQHTFQVLTKRPERMRDFIRLRYTNLSIPKNVWPGVSIENQKTADERIPILLQTPAAVRWVSYEPALGVVDFWRYIEHRLNPLPHVQWIVAGGESGPKARPSHPDWFRSVRNQCQAAGIGFFMKQLTERGRKIPFEQWPIDLKIREFPDALQRP